MPTVNVIKYYKDIMKYCEALKNHHVIAVKLS